METKVRATAGICRAWDGTYPISTVTTIVALRVVCNMTESILRTVRQGEWKIWGVDSEVNDRDWEMFDHSTLFFSPRR
jgi:hypothetical protein